jgi:two-component system, chemotaxis family, chemotaxis protein CheY
MVQILAAPASHVRVLLVDDDDIVRSIVVSICKKLGFADIREASDGSVALRLIREEGFGLVLSDWNMEPVNGLQLLEALRAEERFETTKFVMMTARQDSRSVVAAKRAGVDGYILKPFTAEALAEKLRVMLP